MRRTPRARPPTPRSAGPRSPCSAGSTSSCNDPRLPRETYVDWVRETIVKEVLAQRTAMEPATVPPRRRPAIEAITSEWLTEISESGVDVVGDLEDLRSVWPDDGETWTDPDLPDPEVVADAAIQSLARVLDELGKPEPGPPACVAAGAPPARLIAQMLIRDATYEQAVGAWTAHLRAGGTTDWSAWCDTPTDLAEPAGAGAPPPPGRGPPRAGPPDQPRRAGGCGRPGPCRPGARDRGARSRPDRRTPPLARDAAPVRHPTDAPGPAAGGGADPARRGCPGAPASRRTPLGPGGSGRAVAAAVATSLPPARLAGNSCRRPRGPARPGSGRDRLAPDTHRPRPTAAGDDGRVVGGLGPQRGHPEVEHRLAACRGRRPAPPVDRRGRHRGTAVRADNRDRCTSS